MSSNFTQKSNPFSSTGGTSFGIGQPSQGPSNVAQQPSTFGSGAPFVSGQSTFGQAGSNANTVASSTQGSTVTPFGSSGSTSLAQPSRPLFGSGTTSSGFAAPSGGLFGRPSTGAPAFGQPSTTTSLQSTTPFGFGGLTASGQPSQAQQGGQQSQGFSESSKEYVCVHKETLEKLKAVNWALVSEGMLFHELPEAVKSVLIDVSTRLNTEEASLESAKRESAEVQENFVSLSATVSEKSTMSSAALATKPPLSEMVSSTTEDVRKKSAASIREAEELLESGRRFQTLIQRSLRGLLDIVSGRKDAKRSSLTDDEEFSLLRSIIHELETRMQWMLIQVQSLAIQWPTVGQTSDTALQRIVEGLRAVMRGVGERFSVFHDSVKALHSGSTL